jgi:hypothetical protein
MQSYAGAKPPEMYRVCSVCYSFGAERKRENAGGGAPSPRIFLCACGVRVVCVWCACGVRVVCVWCAYGALMICVWCAYGVRMVRLWCACCSPDGYQFFIRWTFLSSSVF